MNRMKIEGNNGPAVVLEVAGGNKDLFCICGQRNELDRDDNSPVRAPFVVGCER